MDFNFKQWSNIQLFAAAAVILAVVAGIGFLLKDRSKEAAPGTTAGEQLMLMEESLGSNELAVKDQTAGIAVMVDSVSLNQNAWIAVHKDHNGRPGTIIGAQRLNAGSYQNIAVDLLEPMEAGMKYYAMLHIDNGDLEFHYLEDTPLTGTAGTPIMEEFMAIAGK